MKNMVYIQSGGPTSVINTSLYGAIKEAKKHPDLIGHTPTARPFARSQGGFSRTSWATPQGVRGRSSGGRVSG